MRYILLLIVCFLSLSSYAQNVNSIYRTKKVAFSDQIKVDSVSINSSRFVVKDKQGKVIDSSMYTVNFKEALLSFKKPISTDTLIIDYLKFPKFITKTYNQLDEGIILEKTNTVNRLYKLSQSTNSIAVKPFNGLTTSGSLSRGVTIGNNQNSVLNSELDLQISGKLNDKVTLRASIQDANIPLQESGYSQRLDEFDQVFIELLSDNWNIRAGDIDLKNTQSYFAQFSKRVQGLLINANLDHQYSSTSLFASGALVRGQFARSFITAQEGNQGPYKLRGQNGELFVLIVSGSEIVYVNGLPLERGENKDYIIDYNAGELIFNSTYPITSEMRITVDYQFSDRNYTRFIAYGGGYYSSEKLNIGATVYTENDAKNQPLQQSLTPEQVEILSNAGDDTSLMIAPSAVPESYNENRILYKKELVDGEEIFVFSNNPNDELYSVKFTLVGENQGNYIVSETNAINTIYQYLTPEQGVPQGEYSPVIRLIAPTKLQIAVINGEYKPTELTHINFELTGSKNDLNLFSALDDDNNNGFAGRLHLKQQLVKKDSLWNLDAFVNADYIDKDFKTIEQLYNVEFNRDWNIENPQGNQQLLKTGLSAYHPTRGIANYTFEHLNFSDNFNGNRHVIFANLKFNKFQVFSSSSILKASDTKNNSTFLRSFNRLTYNLNKAWIGTKLSLEDNKQQDKTTQEYTPLSQKFTSHEVFTGIGDSAKVFAEAGFIYRVNDSLKNNLLQRVNTSYTYYLKSTLIQNKKSNLSLYMNYRTLQFEDDTNDDEQSINSRLQYNQKIANQLIFLNTVFETNSGTLPQQEFTYIEVEPGQGAYTWIDYNNNGIQELEEFEIAQFQDQGKYIRVLLPSQVFINTHQNRLSQTITINPSVWSGSKNKNKKFWAHFYNQTSYLIDRKIKRDNTFNLNPFASNEKDQLGLQLNIRNVLFFNRGKQRYTTSYTFLKNKAKNALLSGFFENELNSHQINFNHKFATSWLVTLQSALENSKTNSDNFASKNFDIDEYRFSPKLSYLLNDNIRFDLFYQFVNKENTIGSFETLRQQNYGGSFMVSKNQKAAVSGEFNYFKNLFDGNSNSPVGYQMMEGLQVGKNFTWSLIVQKKLTKFLDLNLNYFGRKSETSKTIHSGTVQLRAYF